MTFYCRYFYCNKLDKRHVHHSSNSSARMVMNSNVGVREEKKISQNEIRVWQKEINRECYLPRVYIRMGELCDGKFLFASYISLGYGLSCHSRILISLITDLLHGKFLIGIQY